MNAAFKTGLIVLLCMLLGNLNCKNSATGPDTNEELPDAEPFKILFIGSSYFEYNNLPELFANLADSAWKKVKIEQCITSGLYLSDHAGSSATEAKINEQKWDYVILQGVGRITAYPDIYKDHPVYPALETLCDKISKNYEATKIVFCLPWAYEDGMTWLQGWTDTYTDMQLKVYLNTLNWADSLDLVIAPVGWAWNTVLSEKNFPLHYLHKSDWNHPSLRGSYLMACVIYSTIYKESTVDILYFGGVPIDEADYLQAVASNTVLDSPGLWNITARNFVAK